MKEKWYFKTSTFVVVFLCIGPLALPLLWINPHYSLKKKITITIITSIVSYIMWIVLAESLKSIQNYYKEGLQELGAYGF
ncbi:MAG: hypothetical protein HQ547_00490 [Candidatus Omnitrophica bacterium]|nr:hypothetical protein [Candidatus Omnitrophota bacterium]